MVRYGSLSLLMGGGGGLGYDGVGEQIVHVDYNSHNIKIIVLYNIQFQLDGRKKNTFFCCRCWV